MLDRLDGRTEAPSKKPMARKKSAKAKAKAKAKAEASGMKDKTGVLMLSLRLFGMIQSIDMASKIIRISLEYLLRWFKEQEVINEPEVLNEGQSWWGKWWRWWRW